MAIRKPWSREEIILAMNLYCRIPFGRQHSRASEIIELANAIGRTPGSVAMKLNNITSIDPEENIRGVKGLRSSSKMDKMVWDEFHKDWEGMAAESEYLWQEVVVQRKPLNPESESQKNLAIKRVRSELEGFKFEPTEPTEGSRITKVRLAQSFFRQAVLSAYLNRCCISDTPMPELLVASHIMPWADFPDHRINPSNGLCLSRLHDAAFDRGLITFDEAYRLVLSRRLNEFLPNASLSINFVAYEGKALQLPEKFLPNKGFLAYHRENIYSG
jgi:putative restriction endonuclease